MSDDEFEEELTSVQEEGEEKIKRLEKEATPDFVVGGIRKKMNFKVLNEFEKNLGDNADDRVMTALRAAAAGGEVFREALVDLDLTDREKELFEEYEEKAFGYNIMSKRAFNEGTDKAIDQLREERGLLKEKILGMQTGREIGGEGTWDKQVIEWALMSDDKFEEELTSVQEEGEEKIKRLEKEATPDFVVGGIRKKMNFKVLNEFEKNLGDNADDRVMTALRAAAAGGEVFREALVDLDLTDREKELFEEYEEKAFGYNIMSKRAFNEKTDAAIDQLRDERG